VGTGTYHAHSTGRVDQRGQERPERSHVRLTEPMAPNMYVDIHTDITVSGCARSWLAVPQYMCEAAPTTSIFQKSLEPNLLEVKQRLSQPTNMVSHEHGQAIHIADKVIALFSPTYLIVVTIVETATRKHDHVRQTRKHKVLPIRSPLLLRRTNGSKRHWLTSTALVQR
jgi:hypothetical protein